jgi:hypothetical protein
MHPFDLGNRQANNEGKESNKKNNDCDEKQQKMERAVLRRRSQDELLKGSAFRG